MTTHTIKINRATRAAEVGKYPEYCSALLSHVPAELFDRLTSAELALVLDSLRACAQKTRTLAERDIVAEGAVWDSESQRLIELQK